MCRKFPRPVRRIVIKVGSSVMATFQMKPKTARLRSLITQIDQARQRGIEVVLVSSGAIVYGMGEMRLPHRPGDVASLQALAAIGQTRLMEVYSALFKKFKTTCAQVLLTWDDFDARQRYNNARNTLKALLGRDVVPIVNENDTISTDEIRFGDNDRLSAFVASLVEADLLLLLTDVEGFYDIKDGGKKIFKEIKEITREIEGMAAGTKKKNVSRGGMSAKLEAIKIATHAKIPCIIANGETKDVLTRILEGERIGTFFMEKEDKLLSRKHWISFGVKPKGSLVIDEGACAALNKGGRSLLLPGVVNWDGHFKKGDVVTIHDEHQREIGRGIVNYSVSDLHKIENKKDKPEVIHCDNLVLARR